jgi:colicin import membrane protein
MAARRTSSGMIVSSAAHVAVLLFAAVSFAAKPLDSIPTESMPVDIISTTEFSQITQGLKTAPKKEAPKPLVEKKAEPKPVENQKAEVSEKPEITASAPPPPAAEPPPQPKPAPKSEAKPAPPSPPEKRDVAKPEPGTALPDAEALKPETKPEPKPAPKKLASTAPVPPKRPQPQKQAEKKQPQAEPTRVNFDQIKELIDKRQPRRMAALGDTLNDTPSAGTSTGRASELAANYINALAGRLGECWRTVGGDLREESLKIPITLRFKPDGTLAAAPQIDMPLSTQRERAMAEGVIRAVVSCQPYTMLPRAKYDDWKELPFNFDPRVL